VVEWGSGSWRGNWPRRPGKGPDRGVPVVYYALGDGPDPLYVGSTANFPGRMANHLEHRRSIPWRSWTARECSSRKAAYVLEDREIARLDPPQNRGSEPRGAHYLRQAGGVR
jgi:hypothetical protein